MNLFTFTCQIPPPPPPRKEKKCDFACQQPKSLMNHISMNQNYVKFRFFRIKQMWVTFDVYFRAISLVAS